MKTYAIKLLASDEKIEDQPLSQLWFIDFWLLDSILEQLESFEHSFIFIFVSVQYKCVCVGVWKQKMEEKDRSD